MVSEIIKDVPGRAPPMGSPDHPCAGPLLSLRISDIMRTRGWKAFWLAFFFGAVVGTAVNELVRHFVPQSPVKDFLVRYLAVGFSPTEINLVLIRFTIGFYLEFSPITVLVILLFVWLIYRIL